MTAPAEHPAAPPTGRPTTEEISALTAWMRRLSDAGVHRADPAELAAFSRAKQDLLTRIEISQPHPGHPCDQPVDPR
jgi:hypothetical protein